MERLADAVNQSLFVEVQALHLELDAAQMAAEEAKSELLGALQRRVSQPGKTPPLYPRSLYARQ